MANAGSNQKKKKKRVYSELVGKKLGVKAGKHVFPILEMDLAKEQSHKFEFQTNLRIQPRNGDFQSCGGY